MVLVIFLPSMTGIMKGSGIGIAPGLNFIPFISPFVKCLEQILEDFFGCQALSLLLRTLLQSSSKSLGIEKKRIPFSFAVLLDDKQLSTAQYCPGIFTAVCFDPFSLFVMAAN